MGLCPSGGYRRRDRAGNHPSQVLSTDPQPGLEGSTLFGFAGFHSDVPVHELSCDLRLALHARAGSPGRHKLADLLGEESLDHRRELRAGADEHPPQCKIDL